MVVDYLTWNINKITEISKLKILTKISKSERMSFSF